MPSAPASHLAVTNTNSQRMIRKGWTANPCFTSAMSVSPAPANASPKQGSNATSSAIAQSQSPSMSAPTTTNAKPSTSQTTNTANASSSQLATMLAAAIHEADSLRKDLGLAQRQAAKYERIANTLGGTDSNGATVANGQRTQEDIVKALTEAETRAERAERCVPFSFLDSVRFHNSTSSQRSTRSRNTPQLHCFAMEFHGAISCDAGGSFQ